MTMDTSSIRGTFLYGVRWIFMARLVLQIFEPLIRFVGSD